MTTSPFFLESNSDNSFDVFALTTLFEDNEGSNQDNNTNQADSRYSVHPIPPLNLQVNNLNILKKKNLSGAGYENQLFNRLWLRYKYYQFSNLSKLKEGE